MKRDFKSNDHLIVVRNFNTAANQAYIECGEEFVFSHQTLGGQYAVTMAGVHHSPLYFFDEADMVHFKVKLDAEALLETFKAKLKANADRHAKDGAKAHMHFQNAMKEADKLRDRRDREVLQAILSLVDPESED